MHRAGLQVSAQNKLEEQQLQQKHKKRLSFKDPEIEGPQQSRLYGGCRSRTHTGPSTALNTRRSSSSVEDLSLEDQALHIAQSVGSAFSELSLQEPSESEYFNRSARFTNSQESFINDCPPSDITSYQRSSHLSSLKLSAEDREYLDAVSPPLLDSTMRCPPVESHDLNPTKNCIPSTESGEDTYPRSAQHQIQLLKYHLDQQSQQTQMALHQVQLLSDQMEAESAARRKAQEQNTQLMTQNKDLLDHIEKLFQQIEDLEKQMRVLEKEKNSSKIPHLQEPQQVAQFRAPASYTGTRRPSGDQAAHEKTMTQSRGLSSTTKKSPLTTTKPTPLQAKSGMPQVQQNTPSPMRRTSLSQRNYSQNKAADPNNKSKETLQIGDTSPPVQTGKLTPFGTGWKLKSPENTHQVSPDKAPNYAGRGRTGSFSSFTKSKTQEGTNNSNNTLFSSSTNTSNVSAITNKKYSSSTSDLYNNTSAFQSSKPLLLEEPSASAKRPVSSVNINPGSKLPRFQAYTAYQRKNSLLNDYDQISAIGKEAFKNATSTSLFNG